MKLIFIIIIIIIILLLLDNNLYIECMTEHNNNQLTIEEKYYCQKIQNNLNNELSDKQIIYRNILKKTKIALDKLNIPFFLSSGTCLGYLREKRFIEHDYDIDIGIFAEDYTPKIIQEMKNQGLILYRVLGNEKTGLELSFRLPNTILGKHAKVDIFLHYKNKNKIFWTSYEAPDFKKKITYQVPKFNLKSVNFMGVIVNVPNPVVKYIRNHYGQKWYIPIKSKSQGGSYDYRSSPRSIINE